MIYEWMEGGFFLIQHVDLGQEGTSTEVIGHERSFEAEREDKVSLLLQYGRHLDVEGGGEHAPRPSSPTATSSRRPATSVLAKAVNGCLRWR